MVMQRQHPLLYCTVVVVVIVELAVVHTTSNYYYGKSYVYCNLYHNVLATSQCLEAREQCYWHMERVADPFQQEDDR